MVSIMLLTRQQSVTTNSSFLLSMIPSSRKNRMVRNVIVSSSSNQQQPKYYHHYLQQQKQIQHESYHHGYRKRRLVVEYNNNPMVAQQKISPLTTTTNIHSNHNSTIHMHNSKFYTPTRQYYLSVTNQGSALLRTTRTISSSGLSDNNSCKQQQQQQNNHYRKFNGTNDTTIRSASGISSTVTDSSQNHHEVNDKEDKDSQQLKMKKNVAIPSSSLVTSYLDLAKARLSTLVVTTTAAGYVATGTTTFVMMDQMIPFPTGYIPFVSCLVGTMLCSSSAAAYNQIIEIERDVLMKRTQNRPLVQMYHYNNNNNNKNNNNTLTKNSTSSDETVTSSVSSIVTQPNLDDQHVPPTSSSSTQPPPPPLTVRSATIAATLWGTSGIGILYVGTDPLTTLLGLSNIILYAGVYTYMKPLSIYNTWVGAVVGAIPPVMGWTAASAVQYKATTAATAAATTAATAAATTAAGTTIMNDTSTPVTSQFTMLSDSIEGGQQSVDVLQQITDLMTTTMTSQHTPAMILALTLYCWQLPHFMALSYMHRIDYQRGGFQMLPCLDTRRASNVIVRYTWYLTMLPFVSTYADVTSSMYALEGMVLNSYALYVAYQFRYQQTNSNARRIFLTSLWYLPCTLMLFLLHSKTFDDRIENTDTNKNVMTQKGMIDGFTTNTKTIIENDNNNETNNNRTIAQFISDQVHQVRQKGRELCVHEVLVHRNTTKKDNSNNNNNNENLDDTNNHNDRNIMIETIMKKESCPIVLGTQIKKDTAVRVQEVVNSTTTSTATNVTPTPTTK